LRPTKEMLRQMAHGVHGRICELFPLFIINGWRYRGFEPEEVGGVGVVVILRFEKSIRGRTAFIEIQISEFSFNSPQFRMRDFIVEQINAQEALLLIERQRQLDCAAVA
jgi:hypothetical protein